MDTRFEGLQPTARQPARGQTKGQTNQNSEKRSAQWALRGAFGLCNFVSEGQYHGRHAASFLSARRTASFLQQEEVMFCFILRPYCILTTALMFLRQDLRRVISLRESHRKKGYCHSHFVRGGTGNSDRCTHAAKLLGERPFIRIQRFLMLNTQLNVGSPRP